MRRIAAPFALKRERSFLLVLNGGVCHAAERKSDGRQQQPGGDAHERVTEHTGRVAEQPQVTKEQVGCASLFL